MHAYLESLLKFSDARQEMVTVLYCETEGIRYGKLMQQFPQVTWRKENKFETDLKQIIADAGEYIMFGCDDVVFTRPFSLQEGKGIFRGARAGLWVQHAAWREYQTCAGKPFRG